MKAGNVVWLRISGVCGILTPIVAFTCISFAIYFAPRFSWTENALSDLGVMPGVTSALFNCGLIVAGILGFVFATSLFGVMHFFDVLSADDKPHIMFYRGEIGALFFSLACLALVAIGVFPENVRYAHGLASVAFFVALFLALMRVGITFLQVRRKPWAVFTLMLGVVAVVPWLLLFVVPYVSRVAIPELISAVAGGLWSVALGYTMLRMASQPKMP